MAHRLFVDGHGRQWQVWDTRPVTGRSGAVSATYRDGWLAFAPAAPIADALDDAERRRLAPIPPEWTELPEARLADLLAYAVPAPTVKRATSAGR